MALDTIEARPLTGRIGAEIHGIDLTRPLSNHQVEELHECLARYLVIFFRDQRLDHDSHRALALKFGEIVPPFGSGVEGQPGIAQLHTDANSKRIVGEWWHTDHSCDEVPPLGTILYLHTVPEAGGDTLFANMYAAYDALSDRMKAYLEGLTATHDGPQVYARYDAREFNLTGEYPVSSHPVVCTHPVTKRKLLFVNEQYTTRINELCKEESDAILAYLNRHCQIADFQCRFRWRPHSVAFWDNLCTQHKAVWDYYPETRSGYKIVIAGSRPV